MLQQPFAQQAQPSAQQAQLQLAPQVQTPVSQQPQQLQAEAHAHLVAGAPADANKPTGINKLAANNNDLAMTISSTKMWLKTELQNEMETENQWTWRERIK